MLELAQQLHITGYPPTTTVQEKSNEWYTPARYIEAARAVMGGIDLDPASCEIANRTVKATRFYTAKENGLAQDWSGNIWLNPPYCFVGEAENGKRSTIGKWSNFLVDQYKDGNIKQAILLIPTQMKGLWFQPLWEYLICFVDHSIQFYRPGKEREHLRESCIFVYLGPHEQKFIDIFSEFGTIAKRVSVPKTQPYNLELWTG